MIQINLLDWRHKRISILNRRFFAVVGMSALIGILISVVISLVINSQINNILNNISYLDRELASVEGKMKEIDNLQNQKKLLLSRRDAIDSLQISRSIVVKIFDNLVHAMPDGVMLTSLARKDNELVLDGTSDSNYNITVLMENIQHLQWVKEAKLGEIKAAVGTIKNVANNHIGFRLNIFINIPDSGGT